MDLDSIRGSSGNGQPGRDKHTDRDLMLNYSSCRGVLNVKYINNRVGLHMAYLKKKSNG